MTAPEFENYPPAGAGDLTQTDAERALVASRADQQLELWLKDARRRTPVIMHEEALR